MPKIAVVAVTDPDKVIAGPFVVPFLPEAGKPICVRQRKNDGTSDDFMLVEVLRYEIIAGQPDESGAVYSGHKI